MIENNIERKRKTQTSLKSLDLSEVTVRKTIVRPVKRKPLGTKRVNLMRPAARKTSGLPKSFTQPAKKSRIPQIKIAWLKPIVAFAAFIFMVIGGLYAYNTYFETNYSITYQKNNETRVLEGKLTETNGKISFSARESDAEIAFAGLNDIPDNLGLVFAKSADKKIKTQIVYANPELQFESAKISLNKVESGDINALVFCSDENFNLAQLTCRDWEVAEYTPSIEEDRISFHPTHFSAYAGAYLEIVNIEANLTQGDLWQSDFRTFGTSDLVVTAVDGTDFQEDLSFIGLFCGSEQIDPGRIAWNGDSLAVPDYACDGEISRMKNTAVSPGRHWLSYSFGETKDARAHNFACDLGTLSDTCTVNSTQAMGDGDTISGTGDLVIASGGNLTSLALEAFSIHMDGNITIDSGGAISGNLTKLYADNLTVNGSINANGLGYAGGTGGATPTDGDGPGAGQVRQTYRRAITVTNSTGGALSNYQVKVTINTASLISASKLRNDCGDIRFYDSNATTSLSYYLSSTEGACNTSATVFWVKIPSLSAGAYTIYAYYNRPELSSTSTSATFDFFDDFDNLNGWVADTGGAATWTASGGVLTTTNALAGRIRNTGTGGVTWTNGMVEARIANSSGFTSRFSFVGHGQLSNTSNPYYDSLDLTQGSSPSLFIRYNAGGSATTLTTPSYNNSYHIWGQTYAGGTYTAYYDGASLGTSSFTPTAGYIQFADGDTTAGNWTVDWVRRRQIASPDPSTSVGSEAIGYDMGASGGAHGGNGGGGAFAGSSFSTGGSSYGSSTLPETYGSGGGGSSDAGGNGGGIIYINVSGAVTISGTITANGVDSTNGTYGGGGGAGGSIIIKALSIASAGTPSITANGGNGATASTGSRHGGGGGGGRIALFRNTNTYSGTITATAGSAGGSGASAGSSGSSYTEDVATSGITAICSTNGNDCTVSGAALSPQQAYGVDAIAGTAAAQSGDTISSVSISIEDTNTDTWFNAGANTFDSETEVFESASGTTAWSYDTSQIPFEISHTYKIRIVVLDSDGVTSNQTVLKFAFVNSPPVVTNVTASQDSNGFVNVTYDVTDLESATTTVYLVYDSQASLSSSLNSSDTNDVNLTSAANFPNSGTVIIDDEMISYTSKSGSELNGTITRGANASVADSHSSGTAVYIVAETLSGDAGAGIANGTGKTIIWTAKADADGFYSASEDIKVVSNDLAVASNIGQMASDAFELDVKDPVPGTPTGGGTGLNINQNALSVENNDKTASPNATLTISVSDDTELEMILAESNTFTGASYEAYASSKAFSLSAPDGVKTVYGRFKDQKNNTTAILSDTITLDTTLPATPATTFIQNVSNSETEEYRIFFTWTKNTETDWYKYEVYRSLDGSSYELHDTITDININYIIDIGLDVAQTYYYKVKSVDDIENETPFTIPESMQPNGNPTDGTGPEISDVQASNLANTSAKISWTTDEVATSRVEYSVDTNYASSQTVDGYVTAHNITVLGLDSGTTYNYRVRSCDGGGNCSTSSAGTFATTAADSDDPAISNVSAGSVTPHSAVITWETDENSSSFVEYSDDSGFSFGSVYGQYERVQNHVVYLPAVLEPETTYYYKVRSTDDIGNEAVSDEGSFTTEAAVADTAGPVISTIAAQDIDQSTATITWTTDEPATSFVDFGQTIAYGQAAGSYEYATSHSVALPANLTAETEYNFRVRSFDAAGNESVSANQTFTTHADSGDVAGPAITGVTVGEPTATTVTITWTTDEPASSYIQYSQDYSYVLSFGSPQLTTGHSVTLVGLDPATEYYFRVYSEDPSGNATTDDNGGDTYNFATSASGSTPARITSINILGVEDNTATITWTTSKTTNSFVEYGFDETYGRAAGTRSGTRNHNVMLPADLLGDSTYHFRVRVTDNSDNVSVSQDYTFTTEASEAVGESEDVTPPVVSGVDEILTSTTAVVIQWTTNEDATSQVEYGTTSAYGTETANDSNLTKQHAVGISGLTQNTTYYYRIITSDAAGNQTISDNGGAGYTFATTAEAVQQSTGGGSSRDTRPPVISGLAVTSISGTGATVTWATDEVANGVVNYGTSLSYGSQEGSTDSYTKNHSIKITGLQPGTIYYIQVASSDIFANQSTSVSSFTTLASGETPAEVPVETPLPDLTADEESKVGEIANLIKTGTASFINEAFKAIVDAIKENPSSEQIVEADFLNSINEVAPLVVTKPVITGETITASTGPTSAEIIWITDKPANGIVAFAADAEYQPGTEEPYATKVGNPDESVRRHVVKIENLQPDTLYHFEVRSKSSLGETAKSGDLTFRTDELTSDIEDFEFVSVEETSVRISWSTPIPTRSQIQVRDAKTGQLQSGAIASYLRDHDFEFANLIPATSYNLTISSIDEAGNSTTSSVIPFSTIITSNPPEISQVRINTSLIPGRVEKVQAIVTWKTSKPATSKLYYEEGVSSDNELSFATPTDNNLTQDHILVTTVFQPGKVYRFRVESADALDNTSQSKDFTLLTPKPRETVVDLIISNFENTFSFLKRLGL